MSCYLRVTVLVVLAAAVIACGNPSPGPSPLSSSRWEVVELNGEPPLPQSHITLTFVEHEEIGGESGCNSYTGEYAADADGRLRITEMATTGIACAADTMEQERAYQSALFNATKYELRDNRLVLTGRDRKSTLVFDRILPASPDATGEVPGEAEARRPDIYK